MSNVISIGRSRRRLAVIAWCTYAAIRLEEIPQTRRAKQIVDDRRDEDMLVVKDAFERIAQLSDEALAELQEDYQRRLGLRPVPRSKYFGSTAEIIGKMGGD